MAAEIKTKQTFGGADVNHLSPQLEGMSGVNIVITFEEALKLHLSIGQVLAKLNGYDRSTDRGKRSAVHLSLFPKKKRITVQEKLLPKQKK